MHEGEPGPSRAAAATRGPLSREEVQALILRHPYHRWLGLEVVHLEDDCIEIKAPWRDDWCVEMGRSIPAGGVLAALIDIAADWALVRRSQGPVLTVDLRVDYHAGAKPGDLLARGRTVKWGSRFACAEAYVFDCQGRLLASGRGTFLTPQDAPATDRPVQSP